MTISVSWQSRRLPFSAGSTACLYSLRAARACNPPENIAGAGQTPRAFSEACDRLPSILPIQAEGNEIPFSGSDILKYVPQISNEDQLIWEPVRRELEQLIRSTRHYHLKTHTEQLLNSEIIQYFIPNI